VTPGRRRRVDGIPEGQPAIVGVNIRTLRQRKGWSQAQLGELMGWQSASTVCAAEGRRGGRQRGFTGREIKKLAAIFDVSPQQLTTRCVNCCGAAPGQGAAAHHGDEGQRTVTTTEGAIASQEWSIPGPHTA
jgi:transcriptional regulator with XRE-family HTH domain